jgi:gliding motility-associated-like protein
LRVSAQTGKEFWFSVPEITTGHCGNIPPSSCPGGEPIHLIVTNSNDLISTTIELTQPRNPLFVPIVLPIGPNQTINIDLTPFRAQVENQPHTTVLNKGLKLISTITSITAYFEQDEYFNPDIFSLKGNNALGTHFIIPSQNFWSNGGYAPQPYSAFDIVATEAGTTRVWITPSQPIAGQVGPFFIDLLQGQSYQARASAITAVGHLGGTEVTSDKKIVISVKDDSVNSIPAGCRDLNGDQIIPVNLVGNEYIIMRGRINLNNPLTTLDPPEGVSNGERAFIWAVNNNTNITIDGVPAATIVNKLIPHVVQISKNATHILASGPVYVYHLSGFGCEMGGAVLPTIQWCTGSNRVSVTRSNNQPFYLNLMVRDGGQDKFQIKYGAAGFVSIPATDFELINGWWVLKPDKKLFPSAPVNGVTTVINSKYFHLAVFNGGNQTGCKYGYFSDYNVNRGSAYSSVGSPQLSVCWGDTINLEANGGYEYTWSRVGSPIHYLNNTNIYNPYSLPPPGPYNYDVVIKRECWADTTIRVQVEMFPPVTSSFEPSAVFGCAPKTIDFLNTSVGATGGNYWRILENGTNEQFVYTQDLTYNFTNNTNTTIVYTVELYSRNLGGCNKQSSRDIFIHPSITASFNFTPNPDVCANPRDGTFTNTSSTNTADTYVWDFGDGFGRTSLISNETFIHSFENPLSTPEVPVTYNIEMVATSPFGCTSTATNSVDVTSFIEPKFTLNKANGCAKPNVLGVVGLTVNVANNSQGDIDSHSWTVVTNPPIAFSTASFPSAGASEDITLPNSTNAPITYTISLTVTNRNDCPKTTLPQVVTVYPPVNPAFTMPAEVCNNTSVQFNGPPQTTPASNYSWTFGDGAGGSSLVSPSYTYNNVYTNPLLPGDYIGHAYDVKLKVTSLWGCKDSITQQINVAPYVNADFNIFPGNICSGDELFFNNNSSGNSGDSHSWDFGDLTGFNDADPDPKAYFNTTAAPLPITITYTRTTSVNGLSCPRTKTHDVIVYPEVIVSFIPNNITICDSAEVEFTSLLSQPLPTMTYTWSFGDGTPGGGAITSHIFRNTTNTQVTYEVLVVARSEYGCWNTASTDVYVEPYIKAQVSANKVAICSGESIDFSYLRMPPSIQSYSFAFVGYTDDVWPGDAGDLTAIGNFTKTFTNQTGAPMPVTVRLTVNNSNPTCTKTFEIPIIIHPEVLAAFSTDFDEGCADFEVEFTNASTGGVLDFQWNFGSYQGSSTTSAPLFTHTFTNRGSVDSLYTVTLIAKNLISGCENTTTNLIRVHPKVEANYTLRILDLCEPMKVELTNSSLNGSNFSWTFTPANALGVLQNAVTNNHIDKPIIELPNNAINDNVTYTITFNAQTVWNTGLPNFTCPSSAPVQTISVAPKLELHYADPSPICSGLTGADITFIKNPITSTGGPANLQWDFQDGNTATSSYGDMVHRFVNLGPSDFTLPTLVNATQISTGCTHDTTINVRVHPKVESIFTFRFDSLCTPFDVEFTNSSLNGTEFIWNYGYTVGGVQQTQVTNAPIMGHTFTFDSDELNAIQYPNITLTSNQYHAISDITCFHSSTKPITVYPELVSNFSLDVTEGCNPLTVNFTNTSSGLGQYIWDFGDNTGTNIENPLPNKLYSHTDKENSNSYSIRLRATNAVGCVRDRVQDVTVYPLVEANFIAENPVGCSPLDVTFQNISTSSAYQYSWNFDNGQTLGFVQPTGTIRFENIPANPNEDDLQDKDYEVSLTTGLGAPYLQTCAKTITTPIVVHPRVYPQFSFKPGSSFDGCHPLNVLFRNQTNASGGPGPNNATYLWSFGNTVTSTLQDPTQTYLNTSFTQNKTFDVSLWARSVHGCTDIINHTVTVYPKPKAVMELISPYQFCPDTITRIHNISQGTALSYTYEPLPVSTNANTATFNFDNLGSNIEPYTISLTASTTTTDSTCVDKVSQTVYVYPRVTADFDFTPGNAGCNPLPVTMVNSTSNANYYTWDYGYNNGLGSGLFQPTHLFVNNSNVDKEFHVKLNAESEYQCKHDITKTLTVYAKPVAEFAIDKALRVYPDAQFFFTNETSPSHPTNFTYTWNFGDGSPDFVNMNPGSYTYTTWGPRENNFIRDVSLSVVNNNHPECNSSISHWLVLRPAEPIASFTSNKYEDCSPLEVNFYNYSDYGYSYLWDFGDGTTSTEEEPEHEFTEPGYYNVKLVVEGDGGIRHFYQVYQVFENPTADFVFDPDTVLLPNATVYFFSKSKLATKYEWDFGDNSFLSYDRNPIHTYDNMGKYDVKLTVWSEHLCSDTKLASPALLVIGYGRLRFPNAFIPSKIPNEGFYDEVDFTNEVFHPVHEGVEEYKLTVFNRWGQQIFETKNIKVGWNGYYQGRLLPQDVYVWRATGRYVDGKLFDMRGNVTLLR